VILSSIVLLIGGYFVGSIPSGAWIARYYGISDITQHGSGNIGATNVSRMLGKPFFFLVLALDALKAFLYVYFVHYYIHADYMLYATALAVILGNSYSLFLNGKGGKGIATGLGILLYIVPTLVGMLFFVWLLVAYATRTVGIASIIVLLTMPFFVAVYDPYNYSLIVFIMLLALWSLYRHTSNIRKYLNIHRAV
jgi:acyl phosphate:glycerol-3-phosphate acyltransferase